MKLNNYRKKDLKKDIIKLLKNKYLYLSIILIIISSSLNSYSQSYLYNLNEKKGPLPSLSDLILDNLIYLDVSFIYDWTSLISFFIFAAFIIHKKKFKEIPYFLMLFSFFYLV